MAVACLGAVGMTDHDEVSVTAAPSAEDDGPALEGFDPGAFSGLAEDSGGTMQVVSEAGEIPAAFGKLVPELSQLAVSTYQSPEGVGVQQAPPSATAMAASLFAALGKCAA